VDQKDLVSPIKILMEDIFRVEECIKAIKIRFKMKLNQRMYDLIIFLLILISIFEQEARLRKKTPIIFT